MSAPMKRPWSVRLNAEADRLTRIAIRAWGPVSLHAVNHIEEAARSLRKAAQDMGEREGKSDKSEDIKKAVHAYLHQPSSGPRFLSTTRLANKFGVPRAALRLALAKKRGTR